MSSTGIRLTVIGQDPCPCTGETLDKLLQPAILAVLAEGPLHGYELAARIARMPMLGGHRPDVSGVYRFLKTMQSKRLLVSSWDTSARGPAKKLYRPTEAGRSCLARWVETVEAYRQGIGALLKIARKAALQNETH